MNKTTLKNYGIVKTNNNLISEIEKNPNFIKGIETFKNNKQYKEISKINLTNYLESLKENNIICLINKNFSKKGIPEVSLTVFCKSELNHIKDKILAMNFALFIY